MGRFANKKGRVHAVLEDPESGETTAMPENVLSSSCLLYTSDAADERSSVDLGGRRIIKKKNKRYNRG